MAREAQPGLAPPLLANTRLDSLPELNSYTAISFLLHLQVGGGDISTPFIYNSMLRAMSFVRMTLVKMTRSRIMTAEP
jgi:hypothetical protein